MIDFHFNETREAIMLRVIETKALLVFTQSAPTLLFDLQDLIPPSHPASPRQRARHQSNPPRHSEPFESAGQRGETFKAEKKTIHSMNTRPCIEATAAEKTGVVFIFPVRCLFFIPNGLGTVDVRQVNRSAGLTCVD